MLRDASFMAVAWNSEVGVAWVDSSAATQDDASRRTIEVVSAQRYSVGGGGAINGSSAG